jgi:hypothetical protein
MNLRAGGIQPHKVPLPQGPSVFWVLSVVAQPAACNLPHRLRIIVRPCRTVRVDPACIVTVCGSYM